MLFDRFAGRWRSLGLGNSSARRRRASEGVRPRLGRRLKMEPLEQRSLLSVGPTESPLVNIAIQQASDLASYTPAQLAQTHKWVVGYAEGQTAATLAAQAGATVVTLTELIPNSAIIEFPASVDAVTADAALSALTGSTFHYPLAPTQQLARFTPNDPLYASQWHLRNFGQTGGLVGADANVSTAWDIDLGGGNFVRGDGVVIGVVDDGFQHSHPDLNAQYRPDLSFDFNFSDPDPAPFLTDGHGTAVGGVAAGRGSNGIGVSGAAPNAQLAGLRLIAGPTTDADNAAALNFANQQIHIYNNSWGPADVGTLGGAGPLALAALQNGAVNGRGGLGSIFVWAAGNGLLNNDNANYDSYANSRYVIAVTAIGHDDEQAIYAEPGAPILVAAHSSNGIPSVTTTVGITTTDLVGADGDFPGDYTNSGPGGFGGTSSATPLVAGVIALMLEANPLLSYRDVQNILLSTARRNDPTDTDWSTNAAGYHINHKYGFGAVDALAAVNAALTWTPLQPETSISSGLLPAAVAIPDNNFLGVSRSVTLTANIHVEHVEVVFNASHARRGDLQVELISPSGTRSVLAEQHVTDTGADYPNWVFSTVRNWGEDSAGTWTLRVSDRATGTAGTWNSWQLNLYGSTNFAPKANNDLATTLEDTPISFSLINNDSDSDGSLVLGSLTLVASPLNGTVTIDNLTGMARYVPNLNFNGVDTFSYTIRDNVGALSRRSIATINVASVNDAPVATDDLATTLLNTSVAVNVLSNDIDVDGTFNIGTVTVVGLPAFGQAFVNPASGAITYTPGSSFLQSDTFTYTVQDNNGTLSNVATVTVNRANDAPVATDDVFSFNKNTTVVLPLLNNDVDADGLLVPSTIDVVVAPSKGTLTVNPVTGQVTYKPKPNFFGADQFTYTVQDELAAGSNIAIVNLTVNNAGAPLALNKEFTLVSGFVSVRATNVISNETNSGSLTAKLVAAPTKGTLVLGSDGSFNYTRGPAFNGLDQFAYRVNDGASDSNAAVIRLVSDDFNYVRRLYADILGRGASDGEILNFVAQLSAGAPRQSVTQVMLNSLEYRAILINQTYNQFLGRSVDGGGMQFWLLQMQAGANADTISASIMSTGEYAIRNGNTNAGFIQGVYRDVLGRNASAGDVAFWSSQLAGGQSRFAVATAILTSNESRLRLIDQYFVAYLHHNADIVTPNNFWLQVFNFTNSREFVQGGILQSSEYYTRSD